MYAMLYLCVMNRKMAQMERPITHNDMPEVLTLILSKLDALDERISNMAHFSTESEKVEWLNVAELCKYLPSHPREQTVYSWTCSRKIPFHKKGRSIMFDKKEIDQWLQNSSHYKSEQDLEDEAKSFIESKKKNSMI